MNSYIANFNSESFWRDQQLSRLPSMVDDQADSIVGVMDELQFVFSEHPEDQIVTRVPMNPVHMEYLRKTGIHFVNNSEMVADRDQIDVRYFRENVFELLYNSHSDSSGIFQSDNLFPFAVIPFADKILSGKKFHNSLPPVDVVGKVNSKEFSHYTIQDILGSAIGTMIYSAEQLLLEGKKMLDDGSILIKDVFGVSGKGNLKIDSYFFLQRIASHIRKQEERGMKTCFLVEPFLNKAFDFCCQFHTDMSGTTTIISTHKLHNTGFSFSGSKKIDVDFKTELEDAGYFEVMQKIGSRLFSEGYFGDVCIDSLMLADKTFVPIVEINARKSMSLINHYVDKYLHANYGKYGSLLSFTFNVPAHLRFEDFFDQMKLAGILFDSDRNTGLIPLSANTFDVNGVYAAPDSNKPFYRGQFYSSLVADTDPEKDSLMRSLNLIFSTLKLTVI